MISLVAVRDLRYIRHMVPEHSFLEGRVKVVVGDITEQEVDAVVNAANSSLLGGGGVDGAIHHAGGPQILRECRQIRRIDFPQGLPTGEAVITSGGNLPAAFVIHTVGPVKGHHGGKEADLLARCYRNALRLAGQHQLTSVAIPAISTGAYGYPRAEAAAIASAAIAAFFEEETSVKEVRLVFFSQKDADVFLHNQRFAGVSS